MPRFSTQENPDFPFHTYTFLGSVYITGSTLKLSACLTLSTGNMEEGPIPKYDIVLSYLSWIYYNFISVLWFPTQTHEFEFVLKIINFVFCALM